MSADWGLMFFKTPPCYLLPSLHTLFLRDYPTDPDLTQLETETKKNPGIGAAGWCLLGEIRCDFPSQTITWNQRGEKKKKKKSWDTISLGGQSGIKIQMPVLYVGEKARQAGIAHKVLQIL